MRRAWAGTLTLYASVFGEATPADLWLKSNLCPNCGVYYKRSNEVGASTVFDDRHPRLADMGLVNTDSG